MTAPDDRLSVIRDAETARNRETVDRFDSAEADRLRAELAAVELENVRLRLSLEHGIPAALIVGDTAEEMQARADDLLAWAAMNR